MRDPLARREKQHRYTFAEALRAARAAWPEGNADDIGEAAAAAMDAWEDESDDE